MFWRWRGGRGREGWGLWVRMLRIGECGVGGGIGVREASEVGCGRGVRCRGS